MIKSLNVHPFHFSQMERRFTKCGLRLVVTYAKDLVYSTHVYHTTHEILFAQSKFFEAVFEASTDGSIELRVPQAHMHAARRVLEHVAVCPKSEHSPVEQVLIYPSIDNMFQKELNLSTAWLLMHQWGLHFMIQAFKYRIHANLFTNRNIRMLDIMDMETKITPQHESFFFESCYGIGLARDVYRDTESETLDWDILSEVQWQTLSTPIWDAKQSELRKTITQFGLRRNSSEHWREKFPCFQLQCIEEYECTVNTGGDLRMSARSRMPN